MGVPYRLGGISRQGIDCSAFVQILYRDALGLDLPRTTADQVEIGASVPAHELLPGDLVFFRPYNRNRHVGVYLSRGEFVHASTSNGVMISRLDEPYWKDHYWTARRILSASPMPVAAPTAAPVPAARRVVGW
jgi:cell wall-associated NlpC family hydrolase